MRTGESGMVMPRLLIVEMEVDFEAEPNLKGPWVTTVMRMPERR
jgi:hypothetical protein